VEQELLTLPEHLSSPLVFSGVRVTRSLVLCVCFVDRCLSFCTFGHCVVCSSSIYGFWLPLWCLQTLLKLKSSLRNFYGHNYDFVKHYVAITVRFFLHLCLITGLLAKVPQRAPLVEQERLIVQLSVTLFSGILPFSWVYPRAFQWDSTVQLSVPPFQWDSTVQLSVPPFQWDSIDSTVQLSVPPFQWDSIDSIVQLSVPPFSVGFALLNL
jgi:hypothetical protein